MTWPCNVLTLVLQRCNSKQIWFIQESAWCKKLVFAKDLQHRCQGPFPQLLFLKFAKVKPLMASDHYTFQATLPYRFFQEQPTIIQLFNKLPGFIKSPRSITLAKVHNYTLSWDIWIQDLRFSRRCEKSWGILAMCQTFGWTQSPYLQDWNLRTVT